eukprot:CAMPEP_0183754016 /NCGR_PEP_ID=MMETSP0739-20130205/3304_1 /TAXON_ID=385413 /ORGANISM="Thalassiosira miniscula, Strain CCMP1093" /LENGTH=363 /DNA_ID=CAMNT_0025990607 /DNA_START=97 /DNA_END=1188 /DNA_ORIENTATION=+
MIGSSPSSVCVPIHPPRHPSPNVEQEQLDLRMHIIRQQERLDEVSAELSVCKAENEALKAENEVLINKAAKVNSAAHDQATAKRGGWFSKAGEHGGSMQMLIDANSKLMTDNARLQVMVDAVRRAFQSHINDSQQPSDKDKQFSEKLLRLSMSERTACSSPDIIQEELLLDSSSRHSLNSIPEKEFEYSTSENDFGTSGDDWIIEGEDIETNNSDSTWEQAAQERKAFREIRAARTNSLLRGLIEEDEESALNNSEEISTKTLVDPPERTKKRQFASGSPPRCSSTNCLLVEFGENRIQRERSQSLNEGIAANRHSENLLVDFGERRRSGGIGRAWSSLNTSIKGYSIGNFLEVLDSSKHKTY